MKRYIKYIISLVASLLVIACYNDTAEVIDINRGRAIVLNISGGKLGIDTRAEEVADNSRESAIQHLDVMIFNDSSDDADKQLFYHERVTATESIGEVRLGVDVDDIIVGAKYWVYVVANSTLTENIYSNIGNVEALFDLKEECHNVHLTALGLQNTSSHFLMDGAAYMGDSEPATADAIIIADSPITDIVEINVNLRRAASKVVVKLFTAENMEFREHIDEYTAGYYISNAPYETRVMADGVLRKCEKLETTIESTSNYLTWMRDDNGVITGVELTLYVMSHSWDTSDSFSYATNLVIGIPAYYTVTKDGVSNKTAHHRNYYQVPLSEDFNFERNHYYEVVAYVHAPGADDISQPVEVADLKYDTYPWSEHTINIGGQIGPEYLTVNVHEVKMFNTDIDSSTLRFSSSSPVTIEVVECYYINKFGTTINLRPEDYNISATSLSGAISGNITITSDNPTNNTIRYFVLEVTNQTGQHETVYVEQYPLVYIVNILGYYSYREDFKNNGHEVTTYENSGARLCTISLDSFNDGKWSYEYGTNPGSGFWSSKVATSDYDQNSSDSYKGRSKIQYYYWLNGESRPRVGTTYNSNATTDNPGNARMYHISITATSKEYNLGIPRMVSDGVHSYTDIGDDNAKIVSPSFMTASRLGKVDIQNYGNNTLNRDDKRYAMARDHCANYAEVDRDGNVYDNWRLPTESELKIIMELQGSSTQSADAIDYLLDADYYMSASGLILNDGRSNTGAGNKSIWAIRCIRDAY